MWLCDLRHDIYSEFVMDLIIEIMAKTVKKNIGFLSSVIKGFPLYLFLNIVSFSSRVL